MKKISILSESENQESRQESLLQPCESRNKKLSRLSEGMPGIRLSRAQAEKNLREHPELYAIASEKALQTKPGRWFASSMICSRRTLLIVP